MNDHDSAYAGLVDADAHDQWAFGASFDDPLASVDTTLAEGIDGPDLATYCLMLADDALISAQRLAQWCTNAPELEEEVALANIGLDLLGQARLLLARAAAADPTIVPALPQNSPVPAEDALAFFRDEPLFRCRVWSNWTTETSPTASPGYWSSARFGWLPCSSSATPATRCWPPSPPRASKRSPITATTSPGGCHLGWRYHRITRRVERAITAVWPYVAELFTPHPVEQRLVAVGAAV